VRLFFLSFVFFVVVGCNEALDPVHPSYDRCAIGETCGLNTRCLPATLSSTGGIANHCTALCTADRDCPGINARCITLASDGGTSSQCFRSCQSTADCREATSCHTLRNGAIDMGVCVPDLGRRRCTSSADCAPFADPCTYPDGGVDAGPARCLTRSAL
jgi:hypothetical protein